MHQRWLSRLRRGLGALAMMYSVFDGPGARVPLSMIVHERTSSG